MNDAGKSANEYFTSNETLALVLNENGGLSPFEIQEKIISSLSDYRCTDDVTMVIFKRIEHANRNFRSRRTG